MTETVVLGVALAAGLACPAHMWWSHRRGRQAVCCPPSRPAEHGESETEIDALRARQERLSALIARHQAGAGAAAEERRRIAPR